MFGPLKGFISVLLWVLLFAVRSILYRIVIPDKACEFSPFLELLARLYGRRYTVVVVVTVVVFFTLLTDRVCLNHTQ